MSCLNKENKGCGCNFNSKSFGISDVSKVCFNGADRTALNWSEISVPEILNVPAAKPDIENIDQVFADAVINCARLIETPYSFKIYNLPLDLAFVPMTLTALNALADIDIVPIVNAVNAILVIINVVPALAPFVTSLQNASTAVQNAYIALITEVNTAISALTGIVCITICDFVNLITPVISAANVLLAALNALQAIGAALVEAANAIDPIVLGPAVAAAVAVLDAAIAVVVTILNTQILALCNILDQLPNKTQVLVLNSNAEDTCLSGRKLIIEGVLKQKVVYTGLVTEQSVHSATFDIPFNAFVIPYAKFVGLCFQENITVLTGVDCETIVVSGFPINPNEEIVVDLCEEFDVDVFIEDIFITALSNRTIFKNVTLFFKATPFRNCFCR